MRRRVLQWAFEQGERVLFFPDEHLGRNTGVKLGIPDDAMVVWDPRRPLGGNSVEALRRARLILWRGWCSVHARFTVGQIEKARRDHPGITVIVHPECRREVVDAADVDGSTELILETISSAPAGSQWAVGTEINMVNRLAAEHPDKLIFCLDPVICPCSTMYRIHPALSDVGARSAGRRARAERDHGVRRGEGVGPPRARPHARAPRSQR